MEVKKDDVGRRGGSREKIFREHPHSTWENYFSGDQIMDWLGGNLFGATMSCMRDRFPGEIDGK